MSEPPILDRAVLDDLVEHIGVEAARDVIALFLEECRELTGAITAADPQIACRAAHSLKSSAGQLGAMALAEAALAVEEAAASGAANLPRRVATLVECVAVTEPVLTARLAG